MSFEKLSRKQQDKLIAEVMENIAYALQGYDYDVMLWSLAMTAAKIATFNTKPEETVEAFCGNMPGLLRTAERTTVH